MLLLLDENLPKKLKRYFSGHQVFTIRDKGWHGLKNGVLLNKLYHLRFQNNPIRKFETLDGIIPCGGLTD